MRNRKIPRGGYVLDPVVRYYVVKLNETSAETHETKARNPFEALRNVLGGSILPEYVRRDTYRVGDTTYSVERGTG